MEYNEIKIKLSILVLTIPERADKLNRLENILRPHLPIDNSVELIISEDLPARDGGLTIGARRNAALEIAQGEYVCFVDDDDIVTYDYIQEILKTIESKPDVVGIKGHYIKGKNKPELFIHSIEWKKWFTLEGVHYRPPTHINPVKRDLALKVKFPDKNYGEDRDYSLALRKLLKTEVMLDNPIYVYYKGGVLCQKVMKK